VVCYNDPVAIGAMKAILEAGLHIPREVAVIGAGNVRYTDLLHVPLSTIDQSSVLIGQTAAGMLLDSIEAKKPIAPRRVLFPPQLVIRESSRRNSSVRSGHGYETSV
jgi:LacI family transcriptional regulator